MSWFMVSRFYRRTSINLDISFLCDVLASRRGPRYFPLAVSTTPFKHMLHRHNSQCICNFTRGELGALDALDMMAPSTCCSMLRALRLFPTAPTCCCRIVARLSSRAACFRLRSAARRSSLLAALPILASSSSTSVCKASLCFIKPPKEIWIGSRSVAKTTHACSRYGSFGYRSPRACGKQRG